MRVRVCVCVVCVCLCVLCVCVCGVCVCVCVIDKMSVGQNFLEVLRRNLTN